MELSPALQRELAAHARQSLPYECCGLILGDGDRRYLQSIRCGNELVSSDGTESKAGAADPRRAFEMNPLDYLAAEEKARARGLEVTAIYHSHVGAGLYLSARDCEHASAERSPFPEADQLVIALDRDGSGLEIGIFRREGTSWERALR